jgi:hypothetical protein
MKFETSTAVPAEVARRQGERLRQAGFLRDGEKLEIVNGPQFPSVKEWAALADGLVKPEGDPTICWIAYQAALNLCGGDAICKALAYAAYQACLNS